MRTSLVLLALSLIGALDAAYLSYAHLFSPGACNAGSGCGAVMESPYSRILGIPLSTIGLGLYLAIITASWRSFHVDLRSESLRWVSLLALIGSVPAAILVYLQAFVIRAWCPFCLLSTVLMLTILIVSILGRKRSGTLRPYIGSLASRDLIPLVSAIMITPALFVLLEERLASVVSAPKLEKNEVASRIGDREIPLEEMDRAIQLKLYEIRNGLRQEWLDNQLVETAAAKRGMEAREFVQSEIYRAIKISQEEIDQRYEEIKGQLPGNVSKEMVTPDIKVELTDRKSKSAIDTYLGKLRKEYGTSYLAPASERFAFDPNPRGGPEMGALDAPVTIVAFSDFECAYCAHAHTYLNALVKRRGNDVRLIFKHLPTDVHKHATYAAAVAACAHKQGKFWPLADLLFREQKHLEADKLMGYAAEAGLDMEQLNECLDSGEGMKDVKADLAEAKGIGIPSTPSFFINGHYIGPLPKDGLDRLIDQELEASR